MADGTTKGISDVVAGDEVISHLGNICRVNSAFKTKSPFGIYKISARNGADVYTTAEHPFYVANSKTGTSRPSDFFSTNGQFNGSFGWRNAKDISESDKLLAPRVKLRSGKMSRHEARLLGLFAAEGSYQKKYCRRQGVIFTLAYSEKDSLAKDIKILAEMLFDNCSVRIRPLEKRSVCDVTITGQGVADWFHTHVGEYSTGKKLSEDLVYASDETKLAFIGAWLDGDGHRGKDHGNVIGITSSRDMSSQISLMLNSIGVAHSVRQKVDDRPIQINKNYGPYFSDSVIYRIEISNSYAQPLRKYSSNLSWHDKPTRKYKRVMDDYIMHSIKNVSRTDRDEEVYNLEVEGDNSYVANGYAVHNCNGDIFPEEDLLRYISRRRSSYSS